MKKSSKTAAVSRSTAEEVPLMITQETLENTRNLTERAKRKTEIKEQRCGVMSKEVVAAHLRSLRSDDPLSKGHPRPIKQGLKM